ncbi:MAG: DNA ligase [Gammaproteobacteria bacterium]
MNFLRLFAMCAFFAAGVCAGDAPEFSLAKTYRGGADVRDYYASEKLDGVRAYWDGETLRSRRGNIFAAPRWFLRGFPAAHLDGELWSRRGDFENISGVVRRARPHEGWREINYMVFDMPNTPGDFRARLSRLKKIVAAAGLPHLRAVAQTELKGEEELHLMMREIVDGGGEGVMLRRKDSPHRGGRGGDLLKLKPSVDAEAKVVAHHPGKGKFAGMLGSLEVETEDGVRFRVGTGFTDAERRAPPPVGATITYKYSGFTNTGKPRFPVFVRVRDDEPEN